MGSHDRFDRDGARRECARRSISMWIRRVACFVLAWAAVGCTTGVDFEAHTRIFPDGSVERSARFVRTVNGEEMTSPYVLPANGRWPHETRTKHDGLMVKEYRVDVDVVEGAK
jgi:hypothetical protein